MHSRVRRTWYNEADSVHLCVCAGTVSEAMPAHVATTESLFRAACSWSLQAVHGNRIEPFSTKKKDSYLTPTCVIFDRCLTCLCLSRSPLSPPLFCTILLHYIDIVPIKSLCVKRIHR